VVPNIPTDHAPPNDATSMITNPMIKVTSAASHGVGETRVPMTMNAEPIAVAAR